MVSIAILHNMGSIDSQRTKMFIVFLILGIILCFIIYRLFISNNSGNYKPTPSDYYTY